MRRRFVTQTDIDDLAASGATELVVDDATTLTDLARERARERGVRVVRAAGSTGAPPGGDVAAIPSAAAGADPAPVAPADPGPSDPALPAVPPDQRGRVRAEVRAAVIARLGGEPPGLDRVLDRVLDAAR